MAPAAAAATAAVLLLILSHEICAVDADPSEFKAKNDSLLTSPLTGACRATWRQEYMQYVHLKNYDGSRDIAHRLKDQDSSENYLLSEPSR